MRVFPWIVAGVGIGLGVTLLFLLNEPEAEYETGYDGVEGAARKTFGWGTKTRAKGTAESVVGAVKEGVGRIAGDDELAGEGSADRVEGNIKDAAGTVGHAVGQTIHDLNK
ncbi:MAG: hypothetical protein JWQ42_129 [Edaphobacter sp.]|nr:hypothetical protein [Edaphobacter sp.]